jgi:hypothetical protein
LQRGSFLIAVLLPVALVVPLAEAQEFGPEAGGRVKTLQIMASDEEAAIDGVLDEEAWGRATVIEDLHQINPVEYAEPSEPTEIRLFYSPEALYIAARLSDSRADEITAQVLRQGEGLGSEDRFAVILDPNLDRRSGYRFQVNPNGVRWEALYQDATDLQSDWGGIWQAAASRDEQGWTAEMRIPFKTISFDPSKDSWGINFERTIQRNDESIGWVSRNREMNPSVAGTAVGFFGLEQGRGLDIVPSVSATGTRLYGTAADSSTNLEPSLDVFYKVTPSLNAALTLNTDFSATEVDDRQVNLTRFSLFFPEKRDFFLQDADIFQFGRIGGDSGFGRSGGGGGASRENGRPFFSRNLGLGPNGEPVDIDYGGKLSGRIGRWNVGALDIHQAAFGSIDETDVFVGRVTANVLGESTAGVIVTQGDPHSNLDSSLVGADFLYRNTRLPNGSVIAGEAWYQQTDTEGVEGDNRAFGFGFSVPNNVGWNGGVNFKQIEENFDPAVGFVNQPDIRDYSTSFGYRFRFGDSYIRTVSGGLSASRTERIAAGILDSESISAEFNMATASQDRMFVNISRNRQVLIEPFRIYAASDGSREVVIPPGDYSYDEMFLGLRSGNQRKLSAFIGTGTGDFYDGKSTNVRTNFSWRPSAHFRLQTSFDVRDISLPYGDFVVRLASMEAQYVFSSTLSWVNLIQYDNLSEVLGFNSRLHWVPQAGREGFVVFNHNVEDRDKDGSFRSTSADMAIKFNYTWRF